MRYYKLTDENDLTRGGTQWGEGITHRATGTGKDLCSPDVIHVYDHPLKAVMFNPIHADFKKYHLWECRVKKVVADDHLKVGVKQCTTTKRIEAPVLTTNQRIRFAIYCAVEVYKEPEYVRWATKWLSGEDRTAAYAAANAASAYAANAAATKIDIDFAALIKRAIREEKS